MRMTISTENVTCSSTIGKLAAFRKSCHYFPLLGMAQAQHAKRKVVSTNKIYRANTVCTNKILLCGILYLCSFIFDFNFKTILKGGFTEK